MTPSDQTRFSYEEGFLLLLLLLALGGLMWLFLPFLPGLFVAVLLATATHPLYRKLQARTSWPDRYAALTMTGLMLTLVVTPVIYLLIATGWRLAQGVKGVQTWLAQHPDIATLKQALGEFLALLPMPEDVREFALAQLTANQGKLLDTAGQWAVALFQQVTNNGLAFFSSLVLIVFALFFFYRDGPELVQRIKVLSPLPNQYDDLILRRFGALATVLTASTLGIALMQGTGMAIAAGALGLPWFYLGVATAVASFIPIVGGVIVWGPLSWFLFHQGRVGAAIFILIWGAVVLGFILDNLLRPMLIGWLAKWSAGSADQAETKANVLDHTLLTVLSTLGGVLAFGILGLFFGPLIAAMAITVFDVYEMKHQDWLDRT